MKISRFTHARQQKGSWEERGFTTTRPFGWNKKFLAPEAQAESGRDSFPLKFTKWWRELPEAIRFLAVALIGVHLTLFALWAFYKSIGQ